MKTLRILFLFLAASTLLAIMGASCDIKVEDYKPELCFNDIDDNEDGKIDCADRSCVDSCPFVSLEADTIHMESGFDSVLVKGSLKNVTTMEIRGIEPLKTAVSANIVNLTWNVKLGGLTQGNNRFELKTIGKKNFLDTFLVIKP